MKWFVSVAEWTVTLIKFLKDQLNKLQEFYHQSGGSGNNSGSGSSTNTNSGSGSNSATSNSTSNNNNANSNNAGTINTVSNGNAVSSTTSGSANVNSNSNSNVNNANAGSSTPQSSAASSTPTSALNTSPPTMNDEQKLAQKQWQYCIQLAKYLYEEGLLERQEFLQWILDLLDKMRSAPADDGILKLLLPLALQYLDEFVQSELSARKLAFLCAKKLAQLCSVANDIATSSNAISSSPILPPSASPQSPALPGNNT
ncbi:hypothetical protein L9F63_025699, partial [Diploptera punctata]